MTQLTELITAAEELDPNHNTVEEIAEVACALATHVQSAQKALDPLKVHLRALTGNSGEASHVHYATVHGQVSVTFPKPRYVAQKNTDWDRVRSDLGENFDLYFTTTVKHAPRKDIEQVLRTRTASEEFGSVLDCLHREEPTARVGFKPS